MVDEGIGGFVTSAWNGSQPPACFFLDEEPSALSLPVAMFRSRRIRRRSVACQRFLIALSVRPGTIFAISAKRLPCKRWAKMMSWSSSGVQGPFLMLESRWLCQRSRICLAVLPRSP